MRDASSITIWINGIAVTVRASVTVSAALLNAGAPCRTSIAGEPRTALCGMGICFECRAVVDGVPHRRTCQMLCRDGMRVQTQA